METFIAEYERQLTKAVTERPQEYAYPVAQVPVVVARMKDAILRGTYNKDSTAFRWTCKALGIKHTYKAIGEYTVAHS